VLHNTEFTQLCCCCLQAKIANKAPFDQYSSVRGLKVHYGSANDYSTYPEGPFDVVYDNNGKDMDSCKMLIDAAKVRHCTGWHCTGWHWGATGWHRTTGWPREAGALR